MILEEEFFGERLQPRSGIEKGTIENRTEEYLDDISNLIRLENTRLDLDLSCEGTTGSKSGDSTGMNFLEFYNPSIRAALITFLLPIYATQAERYTTHFRVWYIARFPWQLFKALREVLESESSVAELAELRNIRRLTDEEIAAHEQSTYTILEECIRAMIRKRLV